MCCEALRIVKNLTHSFSSLTIKEVLLKIILKSWKMLLLGMSTIRMARLKLWDY